MVTNMSEVDKQVNELIEAIRVSKTFLEYEKQKNNLKQEPELKNQVDEYRAKNFELQTMEDDGHLAERIEAFANQYAYLSEQPKVRAFLDAELALCRLLQSITDNVVDSIDFE